MYIPSRRGVLRALIFGAAALAVRGRVNNRGRAQTGATLIRHDVASPEGAEMLRIFADAVGKMMAMPAGDPRGWVFQWHIHAVPDDCSKASELARLYPNTSDPDRFLAAAVWDTCEAHFDPLRVNFFLPWHRMHQMSFERLVRSVTGASYFTMPYWNYMMPIAASCRHSSGHRTTRCGSPSSGPIVTPGSMTDSRSTRSAKRRSA